jgi:hypothetical protein
MPKSCALLVDSLRTTTVLIPKPYTLNSFFVHVCAQQYLVTQFRTQAAHSIFHNHKQVFSSVNYIVSTLSTQLTTTSATFNLITYSNK